MEDYTAKNKINNTGHQDRSQDDKAELHDIDRPLRCVARAGDPRAITDGFHYRQRISTWLLGGDETYVLPMPMTMMNQIHAFCLKM